MKVSTSKRLKLRMETTDDITDDDTVLNRFIGSYR